MTCLWTLRGAARYRNPSTGAYHIEVHTNVFGGVEVERFGKPYILGPVVDVCVKPGQ